jgi:hypothetical protein
MCGFYVSNQKRKKKRNQDIIWPGLESNEQALQIFIKAGHQVQVQTIRYRAFCPNPQSSSSPVKVCTYSP